MVAPETRTANTAIANFICFIFKSSWLSPKTATLLLIAFGAMGWLFVLAFKHLFKISLGNKILLDARQ